MNLNQLLKKRRLNKWYVEAKEIIEYLNNNSDDESKINLEGIEEKIKKELEEDFKEETEFLTIKETKEQLNLCPDSIYRRIKTGRFKAKKMINGKRVPKTSRGGKYFITKESVLKLKNKKEDLKQEGIK